MPELSVVIPVYDRRLLVERALRSVFAQELAPAEVIVVDDGSSDDTADRAAALGATVIRHDVNRGKSAARNTGLEAAQSDWVAFLDADDEWLPWHVATLWPERDGHVLVGAGMLAVGEGAEPRLFAWPGSRRELVTSPPAISLPENKLQPSSLIARREAALAAGGFPSYDYAEDLHLWLRMLEHGTGLVLPVVTALYHLHDEQATAYKPRMRDARRQVVTDFKDRPWCTSTVLARHEAAIEWDAARDDLANGAPRARTLTRLARGLASPARLAGLLALLRYRFALRRASRREAELLSRRRPA
jgi:hypothetical protein